MQTRLNVASRDQQRPLFLHFPVTPYSFQATRPAFEFIIRQLELFLSHVIP